MKRKINSSKNYTRTHAKTHWSQHTPSTVSISCSHANLLSHSLSLKELIILVHIYLLLRRSSKQWTKSYSTTQHSTIITNQERNFYTQ